MKQTLQQINQDLASRKIFLLWGIALLLLILPEISFAQAASFGNGIDDLGVPGVSSSNSIAKNLVLILAFVGFVIIFSAFATGLPEIIMTFFRNLNDARKNEDWGTLLKYLGMVLGVIVIIFVIIGFFNSYVTDTANNL